MIKQTVLPFKPKTTKDLITAHAGLALPGEFAPGVGLNKALDKYLPALGSGVEHLASKHVFPLVLMLKQISQEASLRKTRINDQAEQRLRNYDRPIITRRVQPRCRAFTALSFTKTRKYGLMVESGMGIQ